MCACVYIGAMKCSWMMPGSPFSSGALSRGMGIPQKKPNRKVSLPMAIIYQLECMTMRLNILASLISMCGFLLTVHDVCMYVCMLIHGYQKARS